MGDRLLIRRKKEEGRGKKEEGRGKREEGRRKKEEGTVPFGFALGKKREEGRRKRAFFIVVREGRRYTRQA
jgi:hypothetical protein